MCRRVEYSACGLPTFAGCGMHIEHVLGDVAPPERCRCREQSKSKPQSATPKEPEAGFWQRLVTRL